MAGRLVSANRALTSFLLQMRPRDRLLGGQESPSRSRPGFMSRYTIAGCTRRLGPNAPAQRCLRVPQYSSANMIVMILWVTAESAGSGECIDSSRSK